MNNEDGDVHEDALVCNLFTGKECLCVTHSSMFSCSTEVSTSGHREGNDFPNESRLVEVALNGHSDETYLVEVTVCQCDNCVSTVACRRRPVYRVYASVGKIFEILQNGVDNSIRVVMVPNFVRELCENCFSGSKSLQCVRFGASSCLERIGAGAFRWTSVERITIPDGVVDLDEASFCGCESLQRVTIGVLSHLERISAWAFCETIVESMTIPDSVVELGDKCFRGCRSLKHVTFGKASNLERIGDGAFCETSVELLAIPERVVRLCELCFYLCNSLQCVTFGVSSNLECVDAFAFCVTGIESICIPDSVVELCESCL